jgi:ATP-dependent phosphoenolpyruvate carboxykinase
VERRVFPSKAGAGSGSSVGEAEPQIYATTRRFGTVLENVVFDPETRALNRRRSIHREYAPRTRFRSSTTRSLPDRAGIQNVVMLTAGLWRSAADRASDP